MGYLKIIKDYPPYALMSDKRGYISQLYGRNGHTGIDSVGNQWANPVCAIITGTVTAVGWSKTLGNVVEYSNGVATVKYYHLADVSVSVGQTVEAGKTKIGVEGATGTLAAGKHLHITLLINGFQVDPEPYLDGRKAIPAVKKGGKYMIRKVVAPLNLRRTKSTTEDNMIYKDMPIGTLLLVTETATVGSDEWGKALVVIGGKTYAGWCKTSGTWSVEVQ